MLTRETVFKYLPARNRTPITTKDLAAAIKAGEKTDVDQTAVSRHLTGLSREEHPRAQKIGDKRGATWLRA